MVEAGVMPAAMVPEWKIPARDVSFPRLFAFPKAPSYAARILGLPRLQLFSLPTPNGAKVCILLEETGLANEPHHIDMMVNENLDPAFLALNPNGKIARSTIPTVRADDHGVVRIGSDPDLSR